MRKGIWQEFDGYREIIEEIRVSRKFGGTVTATGMSAEEYIRRLHPDKLALRVSGIFEETPSTKTLRLVSIDNYLPPFQAGQYIALYLDIDGIRTSRPYSISSPPNQTGYYDITIRRVENGLISNYLLDTVEQGDLLTCSGPAGNFYFNPLIHRKTMVCIAGGSGITPFMSMIRQIIDCGLERSLYLFYGSKTTADIIFGAELTHVSQRFKNIHYIPVIEDPAAGHGGACGFISRDVLQQTLRNTMEKSYFICGPAGLYDFCLPELETLGIPRRKIKQEMYGAPPHIWQHPGWPRAGGRGCRVLAENQKRQRAESPGRGVAARFTGEGRIGGAVFVQIRRVQYVPGKNIVGQCIPTGRRSCEKIGPAVRLCACLHVVSVDGSGDHFMRP